MYKGDFRWPDGAHIAVVFNMSWEVSPNLGTSESRETSVQRVPQTAHYARAMRPVYEHAFAETGGVQRLLDLWERHGIRASAYADGLTVQLYPELAREVAAKGHELLVQGWQHAFLWNMTADEQTQEIEKTNAVFEKVLGKKAAGYSSPGGHLTAETFSILAERGFKYCCGLRNAEVPFIIPVGGRKLVGMTSYAVSDTPTARGMSPREVVTMWQDYFDALYDEGQRGYPKMLAYGTHPALAALERDDDSLASFSARSLNSECKILFYLFARVLQSRALLEQASVSRIADHLLVVEDIEGLVGESDSATDGR